MSIPIRIHNEHTKDIRVVQHSTGGVVNSYRIPANSCGPTMDMENVHGLLLTDNEADVATDPLKTDADELIDADVENAQDETQT